MSKITGKDGWVRYGSVVVAEMVEWSMSGFSQPVVQKDAAFTDTVATYEAADVGDPGTIMFSGNWDPAATTSQDALATVCAAGTHLTNLYLYANTSTFWRVGSGGYIIVTRAQAVTLPRNNYGKISFEGQVSDAAMEKVGTGS